MVEKVRRSISEQSGIGEENLTVAQARAKLQKMVEEDNSGERSLSPKLLRYNIELQESFPENSVVHLLPAEWWAFHRTVNLLRRHKIRTKEQLTAIPDSLIRKGRSSKIEGGRIRRLGSKTIPFVVAMRYLAIAEARERSSQIS